MPEKEQKDPAIINVDPSEAETLDIVRSKSERAEQDLVLARLAIIKAEYEALMDLIVRPFRGRWETCDGPRQVGLYPTRQAAIDATKEAARKLKQSKDFPPESGD